tara:strand:- start:5053 stop:6492 length:1440 start_codon:yes stop_codon:yes gene_type:complete
MSRIAYEIIFASNVQESDVEAAANTLSDDNNITTALSDQGGIFTDVQANVTREPTTASKRVATQFINSNIIAGSAGDAYDSIDEFNAIGAFTEWNNINHNNGFHHNLFHVDTSGDIYLGSAGGNPAPKPGDGNFVIKIDKNNANGKGCVLATSWNGATDFGFPAGSHDMKMMPNSMQIYNGDAYFFAGYVSATIIKVPNFPNGEPVALKTFDSSNKPSNTLLCVANDKIFYAAQKNSCKVESMNLDGSGTQVIMTGGSHSLSALMTDGTDVFVVASRYNSALTTERMFKFPVDFDAANNTIDLGDMSESHPNFVYTFDEYPTIVAYYQQRFLVLYNNALYWPSDFTEGQSFDMLKLDLSTLTKEVLFTTDTVTTSVHNNYGGGMGIANNKIYFLVKNTSDERTGKIIEWPLQSPSTYQVNFVGAYTSLVYSLDGGTETSFAQKTTTSGSTSIDLPATYSLTAKLKGTNGSVLHEITTSA